MVRTATSTSPSAAAGTSASPRGEVVGVRRAGWPPHEADDGRSPHPAPRTLRTTGMG
jgi:hypothetical protein